MNLFFEKLPFVKKRRIHFNNFMLDVHKVSELSSIRCYLPPQRLHHLGQLRHQRTEHIMDELCTQLSQEFIVICFDEFQVLLLFS